MSQFFYSKEIDIDYFVYDLPEPVGKPVEFVGHHYRTLSEAQLDARQKLLVKVLDGVVAIDVVSPEELATRLREECDRLCDLPEPDIVIGQ